MDNCDFYILILFNVKAPHLGNNIDSEWLDYRLDIFQRYTLKSLINQSDRRFRVWMFCCEESREFLDSRLKSIRAENKDMHNVDFIYDYKTACDEIENNENPLCFLKIDSDDTYHKNTVEVTRRSFNHAKSISLLMFRNGYIYDLKTRNLSQFRRWSICTYAAYYPPRHFNYEGLMKYCLCNQTKVYDRFHPSINLDRMVCCLDHDMNMHNDPRREGMEAGRRTGQKMPLPKERTSAILKEFGLQ